MLSVLGHFPMLFSINVTGLFGVNCNISDDKRQDLIKESVDWSKFGQVQGYLYKSISDSELCSIDLCIRERGDCDCLLDHTDLIASNCEAFILALKEGTEPLLFSKNTVFNVAPEKNFCKDKYRITVLLEITF